MFGENDWSPVASPKEIKAILRVISNTGALLRMEVKGRLVSIVTTILAVDSVANTFTIEDTFHGGIDKRLGRIRSALFEAMLQTSRIEFIGRDIAFCNHDGRPALRLALPKSLKRTQRRELFRIKVPAQNPARCTLPMPTLAEGKVTLPLKDISAGGILLIDNECLLDNTIDVLYEDCQIDLPEVGWIVVKLRVAHSEDVPLATGGIGHTIGCAFVDISDATVMGIWHYASHLERSIIARERDPE
jgi:hypothetical protein